MLRAFTAHPSDVGETYLEHMGVASGFAGKLLLAATAAAVHAIIPSLCERTASRIIGELYVKTSTRGPAQDTQSDAA